MGNGAHSIAALPLTLTLSPFARGEGMTAATGGVSKR